MSINLLRALVGPGILFAAMGATATPVLFSITGSTLAPASANGYGSGENENGGTLLDVLFSTNAFAAQNFTLSAGQMSSAFLVGNVNFLETDAGSGGNAGIRSQETDNLGVNLSLNFASPVIGALTKLGIGGASTGLVSDSAVDYALSFAPLLNNMFGSGGSFDILFSTSTSDLALNTLSFADNNEGSKSLYATVRLTREPGAIGQAVPEPGSLALAGVALFAGAWAGRRRRPE